MNENVIQCRANVGITISASKPWSDTEPVSFIYAPAGVHTITAGFRKSDSSTISVVVDEATADTLQKSFEQLCASRPKQEPYGDEDHESKKATIRFQPDATKFTWGEQDGEQGVIVSGGLPTSYGAEAVNGRVYRSWSPSFLADAEFDKAVRSEDGHWTFPDGVRGSKTNPARLTGVDFVVGALTNKPAFLAMPPVKASKADAPAEATEPEAQDPAPEPEPVKADDQAVPEPTAETVLAGLAERRNQIEAIISASVPERPQRGPAKCAEDVLDDLRAAARADAHGKFSAPSSRAGAPR